jgi:hypothetical protein
MSTLAEPTVLAAAKDALYPDIDRSSAYAVTETQFTVDRWGDWEIPQETHDRLAPFNTIRLASGEPDLLGVGDPAIEVLDGSEASTPVVAIEAKGHNRDPGLADVARGVEQAHARLSEVNLGYVAAPRSSVTDTARSLARDLNVGILGVDGAHEATLIEPARVTGAGEFDTGVEAIRFQASTNRLTAGSFPVNHPKNFLGYALALAAPGDTAEVYESHVIGHVDSGRRGARLLGLVADDGRERLTHRGAEAVRLAEAIDGGVGAALDRFDSWSGSPRRFCEYAPRWAALARSVTMQYDPTQLVVETLENLHAEDVVEPTLPTVVERACARNRPLAIEVFLTRDRREDALTVDGELLPERLADSGLYKSGAYFQLKAQLYHVGLLTSRGTDDAEAAIEDVWRLEHPVGDASHGTF